MDSTYNRILIESIISQLGCFHDRLVPNGFYVRHVGWMDLDNLFVIASSGAVTIIKKRSLPEL